MFLENGVFPNFITTVVGKANTVVWLGPSPQGLIKLNNIDKNGCNIVVRCKCWANNLWCDCSFYLEGTPLIKPCYFMKNNVGILLSSSKTNSFKTEDEVLLLNIGNIFRSLYSSQ